MIEITIQHHFTVKLYLKLSNHWWGIDSLSGNISSSPGMPGIRCIFFLFSLFLHARQQHAHPQQMHKLQQLQQVNNLLSPLDGNLAPGPYNTAPGGATFQTTTAKNIGTASNAYIYHS